MNNRIDILSAGLLGVGAGIITLVCKPNSRILSNLIRVHIVIAVPVGVIGLIGYPMYQYWYNKSYVPSLISGANDSIWLPRTVRGSGELYPNNNSIKYNKRCSMVISYYTGYIFGIYGVFPVVWKYGGKKIWNIIWKPPIN